MNRQHLALLAALLLGTVGAGAVAWRHMGDLQIEVAALRRDVADLGDDLKAAEARVAAAEAKARQSTSRAQAAERQANAASGEAAAARQAQEAAALAQTSEAARAQQALAEAEQARTEAATLRKSREQELDRLAAALDRIADVRRTDDGLVANLGAGIQFDTDEAALRPASREVLARIAGILVTADGFGIQVQGHTDDVGNAAHNEKLSERRARAVRDYLVDAGVDEAAITAAGLGESKPLAKGTTAVARQKNRRVEIALVRGAAGGGDAPGADAPQLTRR